jgi:hypothetical protein
LLDIIIFVPYNLFKLFLVDKISIYEYIYENREKKWKKKRNSELTGLGGFWPSESGRARGRVGRRPTRPASGANGVGMVWGRRRGAGPRVRGRGCGRR